MFDHGCYCLQPQEDDEIQNQQTNGSDDGAAYRDSSML
jgi:hypothetical protein